MSIFAKNKNAICYTNLIIKVRQNKDGSPMFYLEKVINDLQASINNLKTDLNFTTLDYEVITSPENLAKLAKELDLPVVVHCRDADEDLYNVISESKHSKGVIHCFASDTNFAKKRLEVLSLRARLPVFEHNDTITPKSPSSPNKSNFPGLFRIGAAFNKDFGATIDIGFRSSYIDLIGNGHGQLENGNLTTLDGWIRLNEDKVYLHRLDLINLQIIQSTL